MKSFVALVIPLVILSCKSGKDSTTASTETATPSNRNTTTEQTNMGLLGDEDSLPTMPITGVAHNHKDGAVLHTKNQHYYIQDLHSWDERFVDNPVRVWGDIEIRYDAPVFLDTSELVSQGIPVESEEELKRQAKRYWIVNARYELVRP